MGYLFRMTKFWIILLLIALLALFAVENQHAVAVYFRFFPRITVPAFTAYLGAFILGCLFACSFFLADWLKKTFEVRRLRNQLNESRSNENRLSESEQPSKNEALSAQSTAELS